MNRAWLFPLLAVVVAASAPALAQEAAPSDDTALQAALADYRSRANLDKHVAAWEAFVKIAGEKPGDYAAQLWCARTSFHLAHRWIQNDNNKKGARTAESGIACSTRMQTIRPGDYDGRYWELMNRQKANSTLNMVSILQKAKPVRGLLEELIARNPRRVEGLLFLAMAYRELPSVLSWGDDEKALEYAKKAIEIAPRDPEALLELAECYRENGEEKLAREFYQKVQTSDVPANLEWETEDARRWARKQLADMD